MYRERNNLKHIADNTKNRADKRKNRGIISNIYIVVLSVLIGSILVNNSIGGVGNVVPNAVTNLTNNSYANNYINWTWTDPNNINPDLLYVSIYIDGQYIIDVPGGAQYYNATGFYPNTQHTISTQTFSTRGYKSNYELTSDTEFTLPISTPIPTPKPTLIPTPTPTPIPIPTSTPIPTPKHVYYVSPNGNDSNPGTQISPFKTIYKGISTASNGDTVQVLSGTYYPIYSTRPIINKPIRVIGSGRNTIIDGSKITQYTDGWKEGLVEITGNGAYFGNFTVQNSITPDGSNGAAGIVITSNDNIIEKNLIQYTFDSGIKLYGSSSNWALNNTIRYNELYRDVWGGDRYAGSRQETLSISSADSFYIYYNYIHEMGLTNNGTNKVTNGGEGIDAKDGVNNGAIHHNYIYKGMATGIYCDGYSNGCSNVEIYNNIVERVANYNSNGAGSQGDGIDITSERSGITNLVNVHDNIVYNVGNGLNICNYHSGIAGTISNVTLNSNIAYINDPSVTDEGDTQVKNCGNNLSNISIKNNYENKIYIEPAISGSVTLSGNDINLTDIANQFNAKYSLLKKDILTHIYGTSESFRFIAFADNKDNPEIMAAESQSMINNSLNPNFVIFPGDLCPDTNCFATDWKNAINGDMTGNTNNGMFNKTFATRGNHDTNISSWQSSFDFNGVASRIGATNYAEQTSDMTYSFDYGNSHFVGLDVPGSVSIISSSEIAWLDNDLAAAESRGLTHAFIFWHGPIYYVDDHPSTPPSALIAVLNKHSIVSAGFFGHEHVVTYTRVNDSRISTITHPFEEFISGGAGAGLYATNVSRVDYCIGKSGSTCPKLYGYMSVDISGNNFNVTFYNMNGTLDKLLTFSK